MIGEKVKKKDNESPCGAICLKVSFGEAKIISYCPYILTDRPPYSIRILYIGILYEADLVPDSDLQKKPISDL